MAKTADSEGKHLKYVPELENLVAEQGWDLKKYPRSTWWAFKPAENSKAAFGIGFRSDSTPYLYIQRVQGEAADFSIKMSAWNETDDQAEYDLENGIRLKSFLPLLICAYQRC